MAHIFWGFSFMASRVALDTTNMFILLSHRFLIAFLVLTILIVLGVAEVNIRGKSLMPLFWLGVMEPVVYFVGEYYGILHSNTIFSGVMIAMIPIVSTLAATVFLKEMPTLAQMIFSIISVGGVIGIGSISSSSGQLEFLGVIALVVAVLSAVIYTLIGRRYSAEYSPFERTYCMMAMGAVVFTIIAVFQCEGNPMNYVIPFNKGGYTASVLFLAILCSVGSYFLNAFTITYLTVARQTVFANLTTAVSVFAGAVLLNEPFTPMGLLFCAMILLGIYGVQKTG